MIMEEIYEYYWDFTVTTDLLANWQTATSQDAHSLASDPLLIDLNGAELRRTWADALQHLMEG